MAQTPSTMSLDLGSPVPEFALPDTISGRTVSTKGFAGKPLLVMFICNHCPFVKHIRSELASLGRDYSARGVAIVAISSNDATKYPDDAPDLMKAEATAAGYCFPYLFDESQQIAMKFAAACTPDFFLFDHDHQLVYRGQLDDSRPGNNVPVSGKDLRNALEAVVSRKAVPSRQFPSIGCNIKWKPGNEPDYFKK